MAEAILAALSLKPPAVDTQGTWYEEFQLFSMVAKSEKVE